MKFKKEPRTEYKNNIIYEVIFQARFPEIVKISNEEPASFQDIIRKKGFPETKIESTDLPTGIPEPLRKAFADDKTYWFLSEEGDWKIVLAKDFIALSCINYKNYKEFQRYLTTALETFHREYEPTYFNRIGLRYKNMVNAQVLSNCKDIRDFIPPHIAPELKESLCDEIVGFEKSIQFKDEVCISNVRHTMGPMSGAFGKYNLNNENSYMIDIDCFTKEKNREVNDVIEASRRFNSDYVRNIFHWSITDKLQKAMEPI